MEGGFFAWREGKKTSEFIGLENNVWQLGRLIETRILTSNVLILRLIGKVIFRERINTGYGFSLDIPWKYL